MRTEPRTITVSGAFTGRCSRRIEQGQLLSQLLFVWPPQPATPRSRPAATAARPLPCPTAAHARISGPFSAKGRTRSTWMAKDGATLA